MKYLYLARKRGAKVAVVNPLREPGLDRYWVPSNVESAMFGTQMTDEFFAVHTGGDVAFLNGVLKVLLAEGGVDRDFVRDAHRRVRRAARGARARVVRRPRAAVGRDPRRHGALRPDVRARAGSAVLVWSMGITQHERGADNVAAIVNLGLARGNVGRPGAGLMPIRGHSGVQGGAEMGAYATAFPGGVDDRRRQRRPRSSEQYGFPVGDRPGLTAEEMVEAGGRGELDVLYSSGGNFLEVLPDPDAGRRRARPGAAARAPGHRAVEPDARRARRGRRAAARRRPATSSATAAPRPPPSAAIAFSPEIPGHQVGRGAQRVGDLRRPRAARRIPTARDLRRRSRRARQIRDEIARVVPVVRGRRAARARPATRSSGVARGSARAGRSRRPTARRTSSRSRPSSADVPAGQLRAQHPPRQAVQHDGARATDPLTGAIARRAVHGAVRRRRARASRDGDRVLVRSEHGEMRGARARRADCVPATCRCSSPRATCCSRAGRRDPASGVPDYNALVTVGAPGDATTPPTTCSTVFDVAARRAARRAGDAGSPGRPARPHRPAGPVPPRHRRRRRRPPGAARRRACGC